MLRSLIRLEKRTYAVLFGLFLLVPAGLAAVLAAMSISSSPNEMGEILAGISCCSFPLLAGFEILIWSLADQFAPGLTQMRFGVLFAYYGETNDLIRQIDSEFEPGKGHWIRGELPGAFRGRGNRCAMLGEFWLIVFEPEDFWIVRVPDILWTFKRIVAKPAWWGGERLVFQVCCVMNVDRIYCIPMLNESWADELLQELVERRPEALFGYRGEWRDLAAKGRKAMRAEVARRKEEWNAFDEEGRDDWQMDRRDEAENFVRRVDPLAPEDGGVQLPPG